MEHEGPPPERPTLEEGDGDDAGPDPRATMMDDGGATPSSAARRRLGPGQRVGRYELRRELGAGAMGVVFEAHDPDLDRRLAIKVLRVRGGDAHRRGIARARLLREAQALARLDHPNVIAVHDVGRHGRDVYIVMEFIDGETLQQWLTGTPHEIATILSVFAAAGRGLAAAHQAGIVHRDFKPENVMIDRRGRVKVLDFGLARASGDEALPGLERTDPGEGSPSRDGLTGSSSGGASLGTDAGHESAIASASSSLLFDSSADDHDAVKAGEGPTQESLSDRLTRDGAVLGTPAYMSPEQHLGEAAGPASDQFSFCVALYEALYGDAPFAGKTLAARSAQVLQGKVATAPPEARVPPHLRQILLRGLSVDATARFPTLDALVDALEHDPRALRRRRLGIAAIAGASTAAIAIAAVLGGPAGPRCGATAPMPGWSPDRRARLVDRLSQLDTPYAEETARRVPALLDTYADRWSGMRVDACEATHRRHEQSAELLDLRIACLDQRARTFERLVATLEDADAETSRHAIEASMHLAPLDPCADGQALLDRAALAPDPETRAVIEALRGQLEEASIARELAQFDEALAKIDAIRRAFEGIDDPHFAAALGLRHGQILDAAGRLEAAEEVLLEAAKAAERAGDPRRLGEIRSLLVSVVGDRLARPTEGRIWADFARNSFALAEAGDLQLAILDHRLGFVAERDRKLEEQAELQRSALARYAAHPEADPIVLATMHKDVAGVLADLGEHELALEHATTAEAMWREHLGDNHPKTILALGTRGLLADMRGDYLEARTLLEEADTRLRAALGEDHPNTATMTENLAITLANLGELDAAEAAFRRVLAVEERIYGPAHPSTIGALSNLASALRMRGASEEALELNERVLQAVMESEDASEGARKNAWAGLARSYYDLGRYEDALGPYLEVLALEERFFGVGRPGTAVALGNVVDCLVRLERRDEAWRHAERLDAIDAGNALKPDVAAYAKIMVARARLLRAAPGDRARARASIGDAEVALGELPAPLERRLIEETSKQQGWTPG